MTKPDMTSTEGLAQDFIKQGDPTGWFEALYANAKWDAEAIPWEGGEPHPPFQEWIAKNQFRAQGPDEKALVVACGLGHDAEALARLGFRVTAFDISPTAIEWCRRRFPDSPVDYQVADLFDPPQHWRGAFDFVLDVFTIQALPPELHQKTVEAIAGFVAPQG
ncbi:MAG: class I SAM-dependent methyltransferase, partial [Anaerolineae bacterium]|nr:class I SAM-dependent methyltransferase [Anaerolineae bacterium]